MYQRFDKMREVEAQISQLKDWQYEKLTRPVDAFITFEEEDGKIVAEELEQKPGQQPKLTFLGEPCYLKEAVEPTNIIWENRHWTTSDYVKRSFIAFFLIFVLLMISFIMIYYSKLASIEFN